MPVNGSRLSVQKRVAVARHLPSQAGRSEWVHRCGAELNSLMVKDWRNCPDVDLWRGTRGELWFTDTCRGVSGARSGLMDSQSPRSANYYVPDTGYSRCCWDVIIWDVFWHYPALTWNFIHSAISPGTETRAAGEFHNQRADINYGTQSRAVRKYSHLRAHPILRAAFAAPWANQQASVRKESSQVVDLNVTLETSPWVVSLLHFCPSFPVFPCCLLFSFLLPLYLERTLCVSSPHSTPGSFIIFYTFLLCIYFYLIKLLYYWRFIIITLTEMDCYCSLSLLGII